jgi:hypothetical protein
MRHTLVPSIQAALSDLREEIMDPKDGLRTLKRVLSEELERLIENAWKVPEKIVTKATGVGSKTHNCKPTTSSSWFLVPILD